MFTQEIEYDEPRNGKKNTKLDDFHAARRNWQQFYQAYNKGHKGYVRQARRNSDFYRGEQWDAADRERLNREGRPALTLNMVLATINSIIGEQLDRKLDPIFSPDVGGSEATAFALNKITRCILNQTKFDDVEEQVYADGVIEGRGYYDIRINFDKNIRGDICITSEDGADVVLDEEAREYDPKTWNRVFVTRWKTVDQLELEFGFKAAEKVRTLVDTGGYGNLDNYDYYDKTFGETQSYTEDLADKRKVRRVRVIEQQHFVNAKQFYFVDLQTGDLRAVPHSAKKEEAAAFAEENGLGLVERMGRRLRQTVSVDDVLLYDDWSLYRTFTIVPFFPYFRRGKPFSVVDNLIDPQNLLNKTSSQELHIVNTTANSGWVIEENSLVDMDAEDLEERGAETGLVLQYKRGYAPPEKIQPNQIPTGIDRISQKAATTIREVSGVNAAMLGAARADMSGTAQAQSMQRGQVQVSVLLANLKRSRQFVMDKILELIQDFYNETRYYKVVGTSLMTSEESEEEVGINVPTDDGNILNDVTVGNYNIEVGYRASGGSQLEQEFEQVRMLRAEMGVQIPDHVVVQYSGLTKRSELASFLKNSQGFGEPTEEQQQLEDLQMQHQIGMLQRELEMLDAEIDVAQATAAEKMAKAHSLDGFNQAKLEYEKLRQTKEIKEREIAMRIAMAARSHQNQGMLNSQRMSTQMAMKMMDIGAQEQKTTSSPTPKKASK